MFIRRLKELILLKVCSEGFFRNISSEKDSSGRSMILLKVLLTLLDVWLERLRTGLPSCRTDLAKFVREFERLKRFLSEWIIVNL